jgi:hypothetical protein
MGSLVDPFENSLLNHWLRNTAVANVGDAAGLQPSAVAGNCYFSGCTAWPGESAAQDTNEASWTGYQRAACARGTSGDFAAASGGVIQLANAKSFGQRTDIGTTTVPYWVLGYASSGAGTPYCWGIFGDATFGVRAFAADDAAADTLLVPAHGLAAGDRIAFFSLESGGALPGGVTEGAVYFVIASGLTTDRFKVSTTLGGSTIDVTSLGSGFAAKLAPLVVTQFTEPLLSTSTMIRLG